MCKKCETPKKPIIHLDLSAYRSWQPLVDDLKAAQQRAVKEALNEIKNILDEKDSPKSALELITEWEGDIERCKERLFERVAHDVHLDESEYEVAVGSDYESIGIFKK